MKNLSVLIFVTLLATGQAYASSKNERVICNKTIYSEYSTTTSAVQIFSNESIDFFSGSGNVGAFYYSMTAERDTNGEIFISGLQINTRGVLIRGVLPQEMGLKKSVSLFVDDLKRDNEIQALGLECHVIE